MESAGEKNVIAYFRTPEAAEDAAAKLRAMRATSVSVDRVSPYSGGPLHRTLNPAGGSFDGLAELVLDTEALTPGAGVLLAADPAASGLGDSGEEVGRDFVLAAVVDAAVHERALRLVAQAGGKL